MALDVSGSNKIFDNLKNRAPTKGSIVSINLPEYKDNSNITMQEVVTYPNIRVAATIALLSPDHVVICAL